MAWHFPPDKSFAAPINYTVAADFRNPSFPVAPLVRDIHQLDGRHYVWTGTRWAKTFPIVETVVVTGGGSGTPGEEASVAVFTYYFNNSQVSTTYVANHNQEKLPISIVLYNGEGEPVLVGTDTTLNSVTVNVEDFLPLVGTWTLILTFEV